MNARQRFTLRVDDRAVKRDARGEGDDIVFFIEPATGECIARGIRGKRSEGTARNMVREIHLHGKFPLRIAEQRHLFRGIIQSQQDLHPLDRLAICIDDFAGDRGGEYAVEQEGE